MNDLDPKAQALIDSVRDADGPTRREKARVKRRVLARVVGAMLAASAGTSATTTAASVGTVAARVWSAKLVAVAIATSALVAGGAATGVVLLHQRAPHRAGIAAPIASPVAASVTVATSPLVIAAPVQPVAPRATEGIAESPRPAIAEPIGAPRSRAARHAAGPIQSPAANSETLEEELPLLQSAQEALRLGDTDRALRVLEVHAKRFPAGALSEERRAAHALATCRKTDGPSARAEAEAFVRESPSSPLVKSVRKACAFDEP